MTVAQLVRAPDCGSDCREFKSHPSPHIRKYLTKHVKCVKIEVQKILNIDKLIQVLQSLQA